ncbi:hypothetical protein HYZ64_03505 [Candidatus Berkelbacteria bacterium]|nr:hypothetical protein [Candidatus Berkelbacteria bacterium]
MMRKVLGKIWERVNWPVPSIKNRFPDNKWWDRFDEHGLGMTFLKLLVIGMFAYILAGINWVMVLLVWRYTEWSGFTGIFLANFILILLWICVKGIKPQRDAYQK